MSLKAFDENSAGRDAWVEFRNVALRYSTQRGGDHLALQDLNFSVRKGEFLAVLGPSGCGKSTLLKLISGLLSPSEGSVQLDRVPVNGPRRDVGMVFQQATLLPWDTVLDNVLLPAKIMRQPNATKRAKELLEMVGLSAYARSYPYELSGGMQQRVGIARSLIHDPQILLMDEPFAALDALTRENMTIELQSIWQRSKRTVLFITHSIPEAVILADRVLVMSKGPGKVVHEELIDLPRPRDLSSMASPEFAAACDRLRRCFIH